MHRMMLPSHLVGFDSLFRLMEDHREEKPFKYPPHDLVQFDEDHFRLTFAVAGFEESELKLTSEGNKLRIQGTKAESKNDESLTYLHKGISTRNFDQIFRLGPHMRVSGAALTEGLLHINLERVVPDELKPRQIKIGS